MSAQLSRPDAPSIACIRLAEPRDLELACEKLKELAGHDAPFGVLFLVSDAACLVGSPERFSAAVREVLGKRARFGTWCRAVAYLFEMPHQCGPLRDQIHLAPVVFGTRTLFGESMAASIAWIAAQMTPLACSRSSSPVLEAPAVMSG